MLGACVLLAWFVLFSLVFLLVAARSLVWVLAFQVARVFGGAGDGECRNVASSVTHALTAAVLLLLFTGHLRGVVEPMSGFFVHTATALSHGL